MKITKLSIENFLAIGEVEVSLEDKGLCLVQGNNLDDASQTSNGSGKSTLLDAISWALWGVTARDESGDGVVNNTVGRDCMVSVDVNDNGKFYSIVRYRKHTRRKNRLHLFVYDANEWVELTGGTNLLTQVMVNKVIGCSVDVFNAAVYIGQEQMPNLPAMTDKQLKMLIEEAAGINTLQQAFTLACDKENASKLMLEKLKGKLEGFTDRIGHLKNDVDTIETQRADWSAKKSIKIAEAVNGIKQRKTSLESDESDLKGKYPVKALKQAITGTQRKIDSVSDEEKKKAALEKLLNEAKTKQAMCSLHLDGHVKTVKAWELRVKNTKTKVGTDCGECGKPYTRLDIADAREIATKKLKEAVIEERKANDDMRAANESASDRAFLLSEYVDEMTDISAVVKLHSELEHSLAAYQTEKTELERRRSRLLTDFEAAKQLKAESNPFVSMLSERKQQLTDVERLRQTAKNDVSIAEKNLQLASAVTTVYGRKGVRAHILDTVTPFLNERTSSYITQLSDGNITAQWSTLTKNSKGELTEKFSIDVKSKTGAKTFRGLSGGEKRKVRLACSMALQDLVASRATKPLDLYICDEIDDALDSAGLERLMNVLDNKARERGTVLVVSHNDLNSWISQTVTFTKENGKATLVGDALLC